MRHQHERRSEECDDHENSYYVRAYVYSKGASIRRSRYIVSDDALAPFQNWCGSYDTNDDYDQEIRVYILAYIADNPGTHTYH